MKKKNYFALFIWLELAIVFWPSPASSQTVLTTQEASRVLVLENVTAQDGVVSGEIRNNSASLARDVQVLIRYVWLWKNEFHPGRTILVEASITAYPERYLGAVRLAFNTRRVLRCRSVRMATLWSAFRWPASRK